MKVTLVSRFLYEFATRHEQRVWEEIPDSDRSLLAQAVVVGNDASVYLKHVARFAHVKSLGLHNPASHLDFEHYVFNSAEALARRFLKRFNIRHAAAARGAIKYLRKLTLYQFLFDFVRVTRHKYPNIQSYLESTRKLSMRMRIAIKLRDVPADLRSDERAFLRSTYGMTPPMERMRVKDISRVLKFSSPATLSRRIYRVRQWALRNHEKRRRKSDSA